MRVGANSPNLCPIMSSFTATGMCFCPLCTPNVRPTNCGRMVERRLQILMISLRPDARTLSAFFKMKPSTNGPFQTARVTLLSSSARLLLFRSAADDVLIGRLVLARFRALCRLAPRRRPVLAALGAPAVRVIDRVHGDRAHGRTRALPARAARLAGDLVHMVGVRDRAD